MEDTPVGLVIPQTSESPRQPAVDDAGAYGQTVEQLGYDSLWITEGWSANAFVELATVAAHTDHLGIGTVIVNAFTRTPATLAMASASLARVSDGRFVLGLGAGHPETVEAIHNVPWERPVHRMYETVSLVRRLLDGGEAVDYESDLFSVSGLQPFDADVPIYSAALGPANRRVVGRVSDGWLPYHVPFQNLDGAFETVAEAAREAGRTPDDVRVAPYVSAVVSDDREAARDELRANIAGYVGGFSDDSYKNAVGQAFAEEADRIAEAWGRGDETEAREAVTDEMVDALGIAGTPEEARERLGDLRRREVVDRVIVGVPHSVDSDTADRTVRALAPRPE